MTVSSSLGDHSLHHDIALPEADNRFLHELGLSDDALKLYGALRFHSRLSALAGAKCLDKLPSALYRLFYELEAIGLVYRRGTRPIVFEASDPITGYAAAYSVKNQRLSSLLHQTDHTINAPDQTEIITGKSALYTAYSRLAATATQEICVFSIGIAYSPALVETQRQLSERGVMMRHIVQEYKPANYHILRTWRELGSELRVLKRERGFHLMIFDNSVAVISFSSPQNTDDRVSLLTRHASSVQAMRGLFESLWRESVPIKWLSEKS